MPKGRPGGNPDLAKHQFERQSDRPESATKNITLRITPSMHAAIKAGKIPGWAEDCRKAIEKRMQQIEE